MSNVNGTIAVSTSFNQGWTATTVPGASGAAISNRQDFGATFTNGTAADKIDLKHSLIYSLTASTNTDIDLTALTDVFGGAVNFARVKSLTVRMDDTTSGDTLAITPNVTNGWTGFLNSTGIITLRSSTSTNQGFFAICAPGATAFVVDGTHKVLRFTPSANMTIEVEITGNTA